MKDAGKISIRDCPGGAIIAVKAVPGSSRDKIVGALGDSLKIATSAPPEKGKANSALTAILAKALCLDKQGVEIVSGLANPRKEFHIAGRSAQQVRQLLEEM
jgi:uncharacterized protein (TIGR00251 family)